MGKKALLLLGLLVFGALIPALEINATHVFNPHWPAHARLHEVWQLGTNTLLALLCAWLAFAHGELRIASLVALCVTLGFLVAYALRNAYDGSMLGVDGSEKMVGGLNVSALAVFVMGAVTALLLATAWWSGKPSRQP